MNGEGLNKLKQRLAEGRFRRTLLGYAPKEVTKLLKLATYALEELETEKAKVEHTLAGYRAQEENLRQALLRAEETARRIREEALQEAARLQAKTQAETERLLAEASKEVRELEEEKLRYKRALRERIRNYEREAQALLDRFYVVVRRHLALVEEEFVGEVKTLLERFERELQELSVPALSVEVPQGVESHPEAVAAASVAEKGDPSPDEALLLGTVLQEDLRDELGRVVVAAGEVLTPEILERVIAQGLYGELITKLAEQKAAEEDS